MASGNATFLSCSHEIQKKNWPSLTLINKRMLITPKSLPVTKNTRRLLFEWFSVRGKHLISGGYYLKMACKLSFVSRWWGNSWIIISWVLWRLLFRCLWAWQGFMRKYIRVLSMDTTWSVKQHRKTSSQFSSPPPPPPPLQNQLCSKSVCQLKMACVPRLAALNSYNMKLLSMAPVYCYLGHFTMLSCPHHRPIYVE